MTRTYFTEEEITAFHPAEKIGLIACLNQQNQVHMTLITSIMASGPEQLTLGQFCTGLGKWYIQENNKLSFLIMTLDRKLWRGKARWTHKRLDGPEYERYNELPMFRYNTYFGINTVHYMDLVETGGQESLPMARIVPAALLTKLLKRGLTSGRSERILKSFAENLFNDLGALKFLSFLGEDGYPVIIPIIQCQAADSRRLAFSSLPYREELKSLKPKTEVAVFCLNLKMQSVLIRGTFNGFSQSTLANLGSIDINWVYNSMPPIHEQIYPPVELNPVADY